MLLLRKAGSPYLCCIKRESGLDRNPVRSFWRTHCPWGKSQWSFWMCPGCIIKETKACPGMLARLLLGQMDKGELELRVAVRKAPRSWAKLLWWKRNLEQRVRMGIGTILTCHFFSFNHPFIYLSSSRPLVKTYVLGMGSFSEVEEPVLVSGEEIPNFEESPSPPFF